MAPTLETHWYYLGADGKVVTGPQVIDGVRVYFNYRGHQAKGDFGYDGYYYDKDTGALVKNSFVSLEQPSGTLIYYLDNEGNTIKGEQIINGKHLNFGEYGIQVKGNFAPNGLFYDAITGEPVTNRYVLLPYLDKNILHDIFRRFKRTDNRIYKYRCYLFQCIRKFTA